MEGVFFLFGPPIQNLRGLPSLHVLSSAKASPRAKKGCGFNILYKSSNKEKMSFMNER